MIKQEQIITGNKNNNSNENLFRDVRDMIFMSAYIYVHAEKISEARGAPWWKFWDGSKENEDRMKELTTFSTSNSTSTSIKEMLDIFGGKSDSTNKKTSKKDMNDMDDMNDPQQIVQSYANNEEEEELKDVTSLEEGSLWTTKNKILEIHADTDDVSQSCVYAITKDTKHHRIVVTFRGTSNFGDWMTDARALIKKEIDNPVKALRENTPKVAMHRGFANALNDEKIAQNVKEYIEKEESEDETKKYRLYVTGHSMGGALATILGLYAAVSNDPIYTKNGPVTIMSCSSPRVGNTSFFKSFRYLEEEGSLRHARIRNMNDQITMAPYVLGTYQHVGMEIKLGHECRPIVSYPLRQLDVSGWERIKVLTSLNVGFYHGCKLLYTRIKDLDTTRRLFRATSIETEYRKKLGLDPTIFMTAEYLSSNDKPLVFPKTGVSLIQEKNGNLVLKDNEKGYNLWESGVKLDEGEYYTRFQGDGNLLTHCGNPYDKADDLSKKSVWSTKTNKGKEHNGNVFLVLSVDKKMLSIRKNSPTSDDEHDVLWKACTVLGQKMVTNCTCTTCSIFTTGDYLSSKDKPLIRSGVSLIQEKNGNLVLKDNEKDYNLWESAWEIDVKLDEGEYYTRFQGDGNLVTRSGSANDAGASNSKSVWSTKTKGQNSNLSLVLSADKKMLSIRKNSPTSDDEHDILWRACTVLGRKIVAECTCATCVKPALSTSHQRAQ